MEKLMKELLSKMIDEERLKPVSFEPVEQFFTADYSKILFSNEFMTAYKATSTDRKDTNLYCLQKFEKVHNSHTAEWIRRWNHIIEMMKTNNNGLLQHFACHIEKIENTQDSNVYLVSEYAENTLRTDKLKLRLSPADIIKAMYQVTAPLIQLKSSGYYHYCINPDAICVIKNADGSTSYKLSNLGGWIKTSETEYSKMPEYEHCFPLDYNPQRKDSKSDVYSLGITAMELIGIDNETLKTYKKNRPDPSYHTSFGSMQGRLVYILLQAVDTNPKMRVSLESLNSLLKTMVGATEFNTMEFDSLFTSLRNVP